MKNKFYTEKLRKKKTLRENTENVTEMYHNLIIKSVFWGTTWLELTKIFHHPPIPPLM